MPFSVHRLRLSFFIVSQNGAGPSRRACPDMYVQLSDAEEASRQGPAERENQYAPADSSSSQILCQRVSDRSRAL